MKLNKMKNKKLIKKKIWCKLNYHLKKNNRIKPRKNKNKVKLLLMMRKKTVRKRLNQKVLLKQLKKKNKQEMKVLLVLLIMKQKIKRKTLSENQPDLQHKNLLENSLKVKHQPKNLLKKKKLLWKYLKKNQL